MVLHRHNATDVDNKYNVAWYKIFEKDNRGGIKIQFVWVKASKCDKSQIYFAWWTLIIEYCIKC